MKFLKPELFQRFGTVITEDGETVEPSPEAVAEAERDLVAAFAANQRHLAELDGKVPESAIEFAQVDFHRGTIGFADQPSPGELVLEVDVREDPLSPWGVYRLHFTGVVLSSDLDLLHGVWEAHEVDVHLTGAFECRILLFGHTEFIIAANDVAVELLETEPDWCEEREYEPLYAHQIKLCGDFDSFLLYILRCELERRCVWQPKEELEDFLAQLPDLPLGLAAAAVAIHLTGTFSVAEGIDLFETFVLIPDDGWAAIGSCARELGADELAQLYDEAHALARPYRQEVAALGRDEQALDAWYESSSLRLEYDRIAERLQEILEKQDNGIIGLVLSHAKRHPERFAPVLPDEEIE